ncbi:MAG: hypothetical protein M9924_12000 [Rhizobiaceae bacterium]|nr:hypothetical protein [Rhizobiaceae bacterium]
MPPVSRPAVVAAAWVAMAAQAELPAGPEAAEAGVRFPAPTGAAPAMACLVAMAARPAAVPDQPVVHTTQRAMAATAAML